MLTVVSSKKKKKVVLSLSNGYLSHLKRLFIEMTKDSFLPQNYRKKVESFVWRRALHAYNTIIMNPQAIIQALAILAFSSSSSSFFSASWKFKKQKTFSFLLQLQTTFVIRICPLLLLLLLPLYWICLHICAPKHDTPIHNTFFAYTQYEIIMSNVGRLILGEKFEIWII